MQALCLFFVVPICSADDNARVAGNSMVEPYEIEAILGDNRAPILRSGLKNELVHDSLVCLAGFDTG